MAGEFVESLRILLPFCCFVSSVLSSSNVILPVNGRSHRRSPWHPPRRAHPEGSRLGGSEWVPHPAAKGWVLGRCRTASPISTTRAMPFFPTLFSVTAPLAWQPVPARDSETANCPLVQVP